MQPPASNGTELAEGKASKDVEGVGAEDDANDKTAEMEMEGPEEQAMMIDNNTATEDGKPSLPHSSNDISDVDTESDAAAKVIQANMYSKPSSHTSSTTSSALQRKNERSRTRHAKLKTKAEEIMGKPVEARTEEEIEIYERYESKRQRKNEMSKERARKQREEIDRIMSIPEEERTQAETAYLEKTIASKQRKNELDRQRRKSLSDEVQKFIERGQQQQQQVPPYAYPPPSYTYGYYSNSAATHQAYHGYPTQPSPPPPHTLTAGRFPPSGMPAYYPQAPYPYPIMTPLVQPQPAPTPPAPGGIGHPVPPKNAVAAAAVTEQGQENPSTSAEEKQPRGGADDGGAAGAAGSKKSNEETIENETTEAAEAIPTREEDEAVITYNNENEEATARTLKEEFEKTIINERKEEEAEVEETSKRVVEAAEDDTVDNNLMNHKNETVSPMDELQLKDEEERLRKRRVQEISMKPKEEWTKEEIALHEKHQETKNSVSDGKHHVPYPPSNNNPSMLPYQHHPYHHYGYYYGAHPTVPPTALSGHYGYEGQSGGYYPDVHYDSRMFPPYHHPHSLVQPPNQQQPAPPQAGSSSQTTSNEAGTPHREAAGPMHQLSGGEQGTEEAIPKEEYPGSPDVARLKTYIKPRFSPTREVADRRSKKNAQSRSRAARLRDRISEIERKLPEDRTPEEILVYQQYEQRRQRKNDRSRERAQEKKEEIDRILAKPEQKRTKIELAFLSNALGAKKRKNEGDRIRRLNLKQLGLEAQGRADTPGAKLGVTARGPMPTAYPSQPYGVQHHPYPPVGYGGYVGAPAVAPQSIPTTTIDGHPLRDDDDTRMDFAPPRSPPEQEPAQQPHATDSASGETEQERAENTGTSVEAAPTTTSPPSPKTPPTTGVKVWSV